MKSKSDPKVLSFNTAIILLIVNIIAFMVFGLLYKKMGYWAIAIAFLVVAIVDYYIIYHVLESFIYKKIKLIYKTIHRLKRGKNFKESDIVGQKDLLENVNTEVLEWAKMQKDEIQSMKTLEQYRRDFVGNVSHELKTPIFNIQGYILTLLDGGIEDKDINYKYLKKSSKSVDRMINIVKDLEQISALESGMIDINPVKTNILGLTLEVMEFLEVKAAKKNIHLFLAKGNNQLPIWVMADNERIRQALINLIDNAIKYTGKDKHPYIKISFYDMDENILIEISDNGMGIAMENIPFLFNRFYRVDKARSRDQGGTGLGLAIVKHIIEAHKQTINVRSSLGVGTTFSFTLKKAKN